MSNSAEQENLEANLNVIRAYLKEYFPNCAIVEDPDLSVWYNFIVEDRKLYKSYKLKVSGPRLLDGNNTPTKTQAALKHDDVAGGMMRTADYFVW